MPEEPRITEMVPVRGITNCEEAVDHYVDWLGFGLDREWRWISCVSFQAGLLSPLKSQNVRPSCPASR